MTETSDQKSAPQVGAKGADDAERIAKVLARAGLCSRREAEDWVNAGRVAVNGTVLSSPAFTVTPSDRVTVDGVALPTKERTRLWLFHKPRGLVTTNQDPEGRPTVFSVLPEDMPRVVTVGRLDINTEGLLLLTNDGGVARVLELPSTGWLRRYRVRAFGRVEESALKELREGISLDGVDYGPIEAEIERVQGSNLWLVLGLREGKNREVKRVLASLGLTVNRLIRVSFGPFQLADLDEGEIREIRGRILRDQLGPRLVAEAGADFEAPIIHHMAGDGGEDEGKKRRIRDFAPAGEAGGGGRDGRRPPRTKMEFVGTGEKRSRDRDEDRGERPRRGRGEGFGDRFAGGRSEGYRDHSRDGDFAPRPPRERRERPAGVGSSPKDRPVRGRRFEAGEGPADRGEGHRDGGFRGRPTGDGPQPPRNRFGKPRPDGGRDRRGEGSEGRPQGDRPRVFRDRSEAGAPAKTPRAEGFGPRGPRGMSPGGRRRDGDNAAPAREGRPFREGRPPREGQPQREGRPFREGRPPREDRPYREGRPPREGQSPREDRPFREGRPPRDGQPSREGRPFREGRPPRDGQPSREGRPFREGRPPRDGQPSREGRPFRGRGPGGKGPAGPKGPRGKGPAGPKGPKGPRGGKGRGGDR